MTGFNMLNTELSQLIVLSLLYAAGAATVIWIVAESVILLAFRNNVARRCGIRVTALTLCLLSLPAVTLLAGLPSDSPRVEPADSVTAAVVIAEPVGVRGSWNEGLTASGDIVEQAAPPVPVTRTDAPTAGHEAAPVQVVRQGHWTFAVVMLYALGVLATAGRLVIGIVRAGQLCRSTVVTRDARLINIAERYAKQLGLRRVPLLREAAQLNSPVVLGIMRPMILLPASLSSALSVDEISLVIAHELGHIRRYDHWLIAVQRVAEVLLFFHPLVWLLSRRIDDDRERCCDDLVLSLGGDRMTYASALLRVAESGVESRIAPVSVAAGGRRPSLLRSRIGRILNPGETGEIRLSRGFGLVIGATLLSAVVAFKSAALSYDDNSPGGDDSIVAPADEPVTESNANVASSEPAAHEHEESPHGDEHIPNRPRNPEDVDAPLRLQVSRVNPPDWVQSAADSPLFLADGNLIQLVNSPSRFVIRDPETGEELRSIELTDMSRTGAQLSTNRRWLLCLASPHFDPAVFAFPSTEVEVYDTESFEKVAGHADDRIFHNEGGYDITPDGNTLATGTRGGVFLRDLTTGERRQAPHEAIRIDAMAFSPDGEWLVISDRNDLTYWKWRTDEEPHKIHVGRRIGSLAFTPDSRYLFEGPAPRSDIEIRDLETMEVVRRLKDDTDSTMILNRMEIIDDGRVLIAGNACGFDWRELIVNDRLHFWDIETGEILRKFDFTRHEVYDIAVSPDGRYLAAVVVDLGESLLCMWDLQRAGAEQGRVIHVENRTRTAWINLGHLDNLHAHATFSVYSNDHRGIGTGVEDIKAKIEVTRVLGPHIAEVRIIEGGSRPSDR